VRIRSESTSIPLGGECAKQFTLADTPIRGATHHELAKIAERTSEEFRPIHERFDDIERSKATEADRAQGGPLLPSVSFCYDSKPQGIPFT
jgi:hypothetical protein